MSQVNSYRVMFVQYAICTLFLILLAVLLTKSVEFTLELSAIAQQQRQQQQEMSPLLTSKPTERVTEKDDEEDPHGEQQQYIQRPHRSVNS